MRSWSCNHDCVVLGGRVTTQKHLPHSRFVSTQERCWALVMIHSAATIIFSITVYFEHFIRKAHLVSPKIFNGLNLANDMHLAIDDQHLRRLRERVVINCALEHRPVGVEPAAPAGRAATTVAAHVCGRFGHAKSQPAAVRTLHPRRDEDSTMGQHCRAFDRTQAQGDITDAFKPPTPTKFHSRTLAMPF